MIIISISIFSLWLNKIHQNVRAAFIQPNLMSMCLYFLPQYTTNFLIIDEDWRLTSVVPSSLFIDYSNVKETNNTAQHK